MGYIPVAQRNNSPRSGGYIPVADRVKIRETEPIKPVASDFQIGGMSTPAGQIGGQTLDPTGDRSYQVRPLPGQVLLKARPTTPASQQLNVDGRVAFKLPDTLGGGVYFKDFVDKPRSEKNITYGGIKSQDDMERDHIISLFLDSADVPENIKLRQSGNLIERFLDIPVGKIPPERRQEGKVAKEWEVYDKFKKGEINRNEAITELKRWEFENELEESYLDKQKRYTKDTLKTLIAPLQVIHKTGQQVTNALSFITNFGTVATAKTLGDKDLANVSYDKLWADEVENYTDRTLTIGAPLQPVINLWTGKTEEPKSIVQEQYTNLANSANEKFEKGDVSGALADSGLIAGLKFSEEFSNPFYLFSIKGVSKGSFRLTPKERTIYETQLNPAKKDFLIGKKGKVKPKSAVYNIDTRGSEVVEVAKSGKAKVNKPDLKMYLSMDKNGTVNVKVTNSGGDILNKNLIDDIANQAVKGNGQIIDQRALNPKMVSSKLNDISSKMNRLISGDMSNQSFVSSEIMKINPKGVDSPGKFFSQVSDVLKKHDMLNPQSIELLKGSTQDFFIPLKEVGLGSAYVPSPEAILTAGKTPSVISKTLLPGSKAAVDALKKTLAEPKPGSKEAVDVLKKTETNTFKPANRIVDLEPSLIKEPEGVAKVVENIAKLRAGEKLEPIKVFERDGKFEIEDGRHRFEALKQFGETDIPVEILSTTKPLIKKVVREQLPVKVEEGEIKASRLEARVKDTLNNLSETKIEALGLSNYTEMNKASQIRQATEFVANNPEQAMNVLLGKEQVPKGLLKNSIFVATQKAANVDRELALKLATLESTRFGQEISILTELDEFSAAGAVDKLVKIYEKAVLRRTGKNVKTFTKNNVNKAKKNIEAKAPNKDKWDSFIDSIKC